MPYQRFMYLTTILAVVLSYLTLPAVIKGIKVNPQIAWLIAHPDITFDRFSECKQHVSDANGCYNAYSAAVQLAEAHDCSEDGLKRRLRFKRLTEHAADSELENELNKACPGRVEARRIATDQLTVTPSAAR